MNGRGGGGGAILRTFPENQEIHLLILLLTKLHSSTEIPAIELRWLNLKNYFRPLA